MEKAAAESTPLGSKKSNLKKSFLNAVRLLLTAFPFEDFARAFPKFTAAEQERLYQLYIQVITSLHENMQDEFDSLCHETQVNNILDTVEHLVEQQSLDPLSAQKSNLALLKHDLLATKKNEVLILQDLLDKAEDQKHSIKARIKLLKKKSEETSGATDAVEKLRSMMVNFGSHCARIQDA